MITPTPDNRTNGEIKWEFQGVSKDQLVRFKETMDRIIAEGVLNVHDGKVILDFNYEGVLCGVRYEFNKWRRSKGG